MKRFIIAVIACTCLAQTAAPPILVVRAARMITATSDAIATPGLVTIRGDRIAAVGGTVPAGARVIDLGDATILPGLVELHTPPTSTGGAWGGELPKTTPRRAG